MQPSDASGTQRRRQSPSQSRHRCRTIPNPAAAHKRGRDFRERKSIANMFAVIIGVSTIESKVQTKRQALGVIRMAHAGSAREPRLHLRRLRVARDDLGRRRLGAAGVRRLRLPTVYQCTSLVGGAGNDLRELARGLPVHEDRRRGRRQLPHREELITSTPAARAAPAPHVPEGWTRRRRGLGTNLPCWRREGRTGINRWDFPD